MTERYNPYIKPTNSVPYVSEFAFVNTTTPILFKDLFYVDFKKGGHTGFYNDNNNYLKKLFWDVRRSTPKPLYLGSLNNPESIEQVYLNKTQDFIRNVQPSKHYYSYVKILEDKQNPQLEGKIMIMKFGTKIKDIIQEYFANFSFSTPFDFKNTFKIIVSLKMGFHNYEKCYFTDTNINVIDNNLDLNQEIKFLTITLLSIQRKEKLEQLAKL